MSRFGNLNRNQVAVRLAAGAIVQVDRNSFPGTGKVRRSNYRQGFVIRGAELQNFAPA